MSARNVAGADELLRGARHDDGHAEARLHEVAHQRGRLVRRDAAGHANQNFARHGEMQS